MCDGSYTQVAGVDQLCSASTGSLGDLFLCKLLLHKHLNLEEINCIPVFFFHLLISWRPCERSCCVLRLPSEGAAT